MLRIRAMFAPRPPEGEAALVRAIGGFAPNAAIVSIIVGTGIFMMPALLVVRMEPSAPIALCFAAIVSCAATIGGPLRRRVNHRGAAPAHVQFFARSWHGRSPGDSSQGTIRA